MSEENISLFELLNLSIGTPQKGAVNFAALHALLHAVLRHLDVREMKTRWRDTPTGDAPVGVAAAEQDHHRDPAELGVHPGTELQERAASTSPPTPSSSSPSPSPSSGQGSLRSRIQTCEEEVTKAMKLLQELQEQKDALKEEMKEMKELQQRHKLVGAETVTVVEKCCHRVDAVEETVRSLRDTVQRNPDPDELTRCVTWNDLESALLGEGASLHKDLLSSGCVEVKPTQTPFTITESSDPSSASSTHPEQDPPRSPSISGQSPTPQEATDARPPHRTHPETHRPAALCGAERHPQTVEALRNISKLTEEFSKLEARVAALEERKVEQSELKHLRELIADKGSQDVSSNLMDQLNQQRALINRLMSDCDKNVELVNDVQNSILQLQAECENLHESSRTLQEDNRQRQKHIEKLSKATEELEEKKADKQMVESEIKADKSALESKVSRLQFDSVTEQLSSMFHELLNKVTGQEQDWHKVVDRLSTEMECKLNRIELDSVKKQLEGRWKNIHEKLQAQGAPEHEDAAALRKQLVDRFHCLSCDRPVVKYTTGSHLVKLPSTPGFPANKSIRPFTVYALEQFRQHYRSERISELTDYSHLTVSRSCGGSHTVTSASQRRSGLQKHHNQTEADGGVQSEEVDIIGLDGHIYKGRLNTPAVKNAETKFPTISTKDGLKTKDRAKVSLSHRPAATPEASIHHGAKSVQCSRSASSSSGRDWPVSALSCPSQSSFTPAPSAAAESNTERRADEELDL